MRKQKKVKVQQLFDLIPEELLRELTESYQTDKYVSKLKGGLFFKLLLYSQFEYNQMSLRLTQESYKSVFFRMLYPDSSDRITHGAIQDRLKKVPCKFFESIYEYFYKEVSALYTAPTLEKYHLKRYDSTMVGVSSKLMSGGGMRVGTKSLKGKRQIKLTTELQDDVLVRMRVFTSQKYVSEDNALGEMILELTHQKNEVVVFDRGLKKRQAFADLDKDDLKSPHTKFVTRIYKNSKITYLKKNLTPENLKDSPIEYLEDSLVQLHAGQHSKKVDNCFRLIKIKRKEDGEVLLFLTNLFEASAIIIAEIYKRRWDIEVLFRFLKQEMNLNHLLSHHPNAIQSVIYINLIAAMMVLIYRKHNNIKSLKIAKNRFFKELQEIILLEYLSAPNGAEYLKHILINNIHKE